MQSINLSNAPLTYRHWSLKQSINEVFCYTTSYICIFGDLTSNVGFISWCVYLFCFLTWGQSLHHCEKLGCAVLLWMQGGWPFRGTKISVKLARCKCWQSPRKSISFSNAQLVLLLTVLVFSHVTPSSICLQEKSVLTSLSERLLTEHEAKILKRVFFTSNSPRSVKRWNWQMTDKGSSVNLTRNLKNASQATLQLFLRSALGSSGNCQIEFHNNTLEILLKPGHEIKP